MEIEELFRSKLENAELIPGDSVRSNLMRKVGRQEFLRFNPSRFNIYYAGGIAAAIVTAVLLVSSGRHGRSAENLVNQNQGQEINAAANPQPGQNNISFTENKTVTKVNTGKPVTITENKERLNQVSAKGDEKSSVSERKESVPVNKQETPSKSGLIMENLGTGNVKGIQLQQKTVSDFYASVSSGCMPLKVKFINRSAAWDSCRWIFGDGGFSTEANPSWIFDVAGEYKVTLKVFGQNGVESTSAQVLNVYPRPAARFEVYPQTPIIPDDQIRFINYSVDAVRSRWEFGDGKSSEAFEPEHKYQVYSKYNVRLIVWSEHGCTDSLLLTDAFAVSGCYLNFPNAFMPNTAGPSGGNYSTKSDEAAQIFHPVTSGVSEYQLRIFSKIGILIFESNDINVGWDGYHKGQLCETGVYIWKVRGTYKNGETFVKMGDVTLLK